MPQFISLRTQYQGATCTVPAQVSASATRRRLTLTQDWNHQLTPAENHQEAATAWCRRFAPQTQLIGPATPTDTTYQWLIQLPEA